MQLLSAAAFIPLWACCAGVVEDARLMGVNDALIKCARGLFHTPDGRLFGSISNPHHKEGVPTCRVLIPGIDLRAALADSQEQGGGARTIMPTLAVAGFDTGHVGCRRFCRLCVFAPF